MANTYSLQSAVIKRFLRTYLPQVPAGIAYLGMLTGNWQLPVWAPPLLSLIGAVTTALDKFLREIGFNDEVKDAILNNATK